VGPVAGGLRSVTHAGDRDVEAHRRTGRKTADGCADLQTRGLIVLHQRCSETAVRSGQPEGH
jgi:hypothetical protein